MVSLHSAISDKLHPDGSPVLIAGRDGYLVQHLRVMD